MIDAGPADEMLYLSVSEEWRPTRDKALAHWNLQQPAWKPFKTWTQLTLTEKLQVCAIEVNLIDQEEQRDQELRELADRVGDLVGISLSSGSSSAAIYSGRS